MTQCCHAVSSSIWQYRDHENMQTYMADLPNMHKVLLEVEKATCSVQESPFSTVFFSVLTGQE